MSNRRDELRRGIRSLIHDTSRELADLEGRDSSSEVSLAPAPTPRAPVVEPTSSADGVPSAREVASPAGPPRQEEAGMPPTPGEASASAPAPTAPKNAARRSRRRRRRPPADVPLDGVNPAQVHSRTGVCAAYFIDRECWHVPDAYCNIALHVCILRRCPVYHLHKEALERRFAGKYKHFW